MSAILFYTSIKTRVRDQESLMVEFVKEGHRVSFLNQQVNSYLPAICQRAGVRYETIPSVESTSTLIKTIYHCYQLIRFIWTNKIHVVYSHLEPANFVAVLSQFFVQARIIIVRHHHDLAKRAGFDKDFSYRFTYRVARQIITVSEATRHYMIEEEGTSSQKIQTIKLGYDFSIFGTVNKHEVRQLKNNNNAMVYLVTVGRLNDYKRPHLSVHICHSLIQKGIKTHLFLLGTGENEANLKDEVALLSLQNNVSFAGHADNVLDYLKASDWLIHPSVSESSCVVVKEAGLVELPVMVCKGTGDFDLYLRNFENSILLDPEHFVSEAVQKIINYRDNPEGRYKLGRKLKEDVFRNFAIQSVTRQYDQFHT